MSQASHEFKGSVDFNQNELRNATFQRLITPPVSPETSQIYYDSVKNIVFYYNGVKWIPFGIQPVHISYANESLLLSGQSGQIEYYIYYDESKEVFYEKKSTYTASLSDYNVIGGIGAFVPYIGAKYNIDLGEFGLRAGYFRFDTTPTNTPTDQGTMYWDASKETVALIMNGKTQRIGQDFYIYCKNSTGSNIAKGLNVGFAGTDGASGHILIKKFLANGVEPSYYYIGVTAEEIANGEFGQVLVMGELSGVNTTSYSPSPLLYASTTVAGAFQTTAPIAPNNIILVAAAISFKSNGEIRVRPTLGSNINQDEGVKIVSPANNDLLQYKSSSGLWENVTLASISYTLPAATSTVRGGVELFSDTVQTVAANAVTTTASRTYGIQVNSDGQMVVNVPWTDTDTNTTYSLATSTVLGLIELFSDTVQSTAANAVTTTASRTYGLQVNASGQGVVNVPWTDTVYTHPAYTARSITATGASVLSTFTSDATGHVTAITTRLLTVGDIGAAATNQTMHIGTTAVAINRASAALVLTGITSIDGTSTGVLRTVTGTNTAELVRGNMADNDQFRILVGGTASNAGYAEIATADDGTEPIYVRQYTGTFTTLIRTATLLDGSGNTSFPGSLTANSIIKSGGTSSQFLKADGSVDSNTYALSSALSSYVPTSRTLTINGTSFDLSANRSWTISTTETDTLQSVTSRGNTTTVPIGIISADNVGVFQSQNSSASNATQFYIDHDSANTKIGNLRGALIFHTSTSEVMRLTTTGRLLLGSTTDYGTTLSVTGGGVFTGNLNVGQASSAGETAINIGQNKTVASPAYIDFQSSAGSTDYDLRILKESGTSGGASITNAGGSFQIINNTNDTIAFATQATIRMSVLGGGNVLIGTSTDSGDKLRVNGTILTDSTIKTAAPTGSSAQPWKLGSANFTSSGSPTHQVIIEISGTVYKLLAVT